MSNLEDPSGLQSGNALPEAQPAESQQENVQGVSFETMKTEVAGKIREVAGDVLPNPQDAEKATDAYGATLAEELPGGVDSYYGEALKNIDEVLPTVASEARSGSASNEADIDRAHNFGMELGFAVIGNSDVLRTKQQEKKASEERRREEDSDPRAEANRNVVKDVIARNRAKSTAPSPEAGLEAVRKLINELPPDSTEH